MYIQPITSTTPSGRWKHDLYDGTSSQVPVGVQRTGGVNSTTKLLVSNLDFGVTTSDIQVNYDFLYQYQVNSYFVQGII